MHHFASIDASEFVLHSFYKVDLSLTNDWTRGIWLVLLKEGFNWLLVLQRFTHPVDSLSFRCGFESA